MLYRLMSDRGQFVLHDNAALEAFWSTMTIEMVYCRRFLTRNQARIAIFDYIEGLYNWARLHFAFGNKCPLDYFLFYGSPR